MTIILAKIFGLYLLGVGIALMLNPERFTRIYKEMVRNESILLLGAIFALIFGAFIISVHNIWIWDWPVLITVLGWISLIKGLMLLFFSDFGQRFAFLYNRPSSFYRAIGIFWTVVGLFLVYQGWKDIP